MVAAQVQEIPKPVRFYSFPNLWRYEQPQRGRLREHWQLNVDILGGDVLWADLELLSVAANVFKDFKAQDFVKIKINHRALVNFVFKEKAGLSDEEALKLSKLLDAKDKMSLADFELKLSEICKDQNSALETVQGFINSDVSSLSANYNCEAAEHIHAIFEHAKALGFEEMLDFDPCIMRGMDYYTGMVFEAYDMSPDNRRALFGGGRYDNLIGLFSKQELSGAGFGLGDVGFRNFLETHKLLNAPKPHAEVLISCPLTEWMPSALKLSATLRKAGLNTLAPAGLTNFKQSLKLANKHNVKFLILMGEEEQKNNLFLLKDLDSGEQKALTAQQILSALSL